MAKLTCLERYERAQFIFSTAMQECQRRSYNKAYNNIPFSDDEYDETVREAKIEMAKQ